LTVLLAIQVVTLLLRRHGANQDRRAGTPANDDRTASPGNYRPNPKSDSENHLESRAGTAKDIVGAFLQDARELDDWVNSQPNANDLAKRIKARPAVFREEAREISALATSEAREDAATALLNALGFMASPELLADIFPPDRELALLLLASCAEERAVWAMAGGYSKDSTVRSRVVQIAAGDSSEFARAAALRACAIGLADSKDAQDALLRASRDVGKRYQSIAVAGLEKIDVEGAVSALVEAAGSSDSYVHNAGLTALSRRAKWDYKAALRLGGLIRSGISEESARRIWRDLSEADALSCIPASDREVLERLCPKRR